MTDAVLRSREEHPSKRKWSEQRIRKKQRGAVLDGFCFNSQALGEMGVKN